MTDKDFSEDQKREIGQRIRRERKSRGWSQGYLGRLVGVTYAAVSQWENAHSNITRANLHALATALNVSSSYLMLETDDPVRNGNGQDLRASHHPARRPAPRANHTPRWMRVIALAALTALTPAPQELSAADSV